MLVEESYHDVPTESGRHMRIFIYHPKIPGYPRAKFPGVLVFSEIYQVTGPVARFANKIASKGYICAAPSSYHDFTGPEPLKYDGPGTDKGNEWKFAKSLRSYDLDAERTISYLTSLPTCTGRLGATGMCLGGHLAFRAALYPSIAASVCFFPTDIHSATLGSKSHLYPNPATSHQEQDKEQGPDSKTPDDSLVRCGEIKGELLLIFGTLDPHVPPAGRDAIRAMLREKGVKFGFWEVCGAQHAFVRDESSKGRYDAVVTGVCLEALMEVFGRCLRSDLGSSAVVGDVEAVC